MYHATASRPILPGPMIATLSPGLTPNMRCFGEREEREVGNHIAAFIERREDKEDISTSACVKELCICSDIQSPAHMFPFFFAFCWSF